jgi:hypothetical protein
MRILVSATFTLLVACAAPAFSQGTFGFTEVGGTPAGYNTPGNQFTANNGVMGTAYDQQTVTVDGVTVNKSTSDVVMTENNSAPYNFGQMDPAYIQNTGPLANTNTAKVIDSNYLRMTQCVPGGPTQMGLLAPNSVNQAGFQGGHNLGFPGAQGLDGLSLYGSRWRGANGCSLPCTGTGEPAVDVTPGGGYY